MGRAGAGPVHSERVGRALHATELNKPIAQLVSNMKRCARVVDLRLARPRGPLLPYLSRRSIDEASLKLEKLRLQGGVYVDRCTKIRAYPFDPTKRPELGRNRRLIHFQRHGQAFHNSAEGWCGARGWGRVGVGGIDDPRD